MKEHTNIFSETQDLITKEEIKNLLSSRWKKKSFEDSGLEHYGCFFTVVFKSKDFFKELFRDYENNIKKYI